MASTTATPRATAKIVSTARTGSRASGLIINCQKMWSAGCITICYESLQLREPISKTASFPLNVGDPAVAQGDYYVRDSRRFGTVRSHQRCGVLFACQSPE